MQDGRDGRAHAEAAQGAAEGDGRIQRMPNCPTNEAKEDGMHRSGLSVLLIVCLFCVGFSSTPDSRVIMGKWVLVNGVYAGAVVFVDSTPKADRDSAQGLDVSYRGKLTITPFQMSLEGWKPGDVLWSDIRLRFVTDTLGGVEYNFSEVLIDRMCTEDGSSSYSTRVRRTVTVICNGPDTLIAQRLRGTGICYFGTPGAVACDIWERP
jgi:hypothetical protein